MKYALLGGDERSVILRRLLIADGHEVACFAIEKAATGETSAKAAVTGADCIILPLPCTRDGLLNAPLSSTKHYIADLLDSIAPGTLVCAGKTQDIASECESRSLPLYDYFAREDFAVLNADLTALGAVELILRSCKTTIRNRKILICGFGRIGKLLALKLIALGAKVTVTARSSEQLAWATCLGCETRALTKRADERFDYAINTIPEPIFGIEYLKSLEGATLIELASSPYGFSQEDAAKLNLELVLAPGLPGICTPTSAGEIVRDVIYRIMEESK